MGSAFGALEWLEEQVLALEKGGTPPHQADCRALGLDQHHPVLCLIKPGGRGTGGSRAMTACATGVTPWARLPATCRVGRLTS